MYLSMSPALAALPAAADSPPEPTGSDVVEPGSA